jgi:rare lipoprotein A
MSQNLLKIIAIAALSLSVANCAQTPERTAGKSNVDAKYGVVASPRVVEEGKSVPIGGGRNMVGKPYTIAGKRYTPYDKPVGYKIAGTASWYGAAFHGRRTANGEIFDRHALMAAHPTMPLPSYARVTNQRNGRSIIVRVNDRGPYHGGRVLDVSEKAAQLLEFKHMGTAPIAVEYLGRAELAGSNDNKLLASLRVDGSPAPFSGTTGRTLVASAEPTFVPSTPVIASPVVAASKPALEVEPSNTLSEKAPLKIEEAQPVSASLTTSPSTTPLASSKPMPLPTERPVQAAAVDLPVKATSSKAVDALEDSADEEDEAPKATTTKANTSKETHSKAAPPSAMKDVPMPPVRPQGQRAFHMQDIKSNKS